MSTETTQPRRTTPAQDEWNPVLERFAKDLLVLTKVSLVYPEGHPATLQVAQRLCDWSATANLEEVAIGFTPSKLLFRDRFFGAPGSRCALLAALFHGRKIMRMTWPPGISLTDVTTLAFILARSRRVGSELRNEFREAGVYSIDLDPLDAGKIHGALTQGTAASSDQGVTAPRGLEAWLWLQEENLLPRTLAETLLSEGFWSLAEADPAAAFPLLLRQLAKLPPALDLLPEQDKVRIRKRLTALPKALTIAELADAVDATGEALQEEASSLLLLDELTPAVVVQLMAELVRKSGADGTRVGVLFRHLVPRFGAQELLTLTQARVASDTGPAQALDAWRTLETFLQEGAQDNFFTEEYGNDLASLQEGAQAKTLVSASPLLENAELHVDRICFDLARDGDPDRVLRLRRRLAARVHTSSLSNLLSVATAAAEHIPAVFLGEPELVRELFSRFLASAQVLDSEGRSAAVAFARCQEDAILDLTITSLIREPRIVRRRLLIDVLSGLSPETTPQVLRRGSVAPWYFIRNVATVLGRRGDREEAPILEALLHHPHEKVRREALKSLAGMTGAAARAVEAFAADTSRPADERALASSLFSRRKARRGDKPSA